MSGESFEVRTSQDRAEQMDVIIFCMRRGLCEKRRRSEPPTINSTPDHLAITHWCHAHICCRMGNMEQIEFVIYPDGRVEEKVTGVKGKNVGAPLSCTSPSSAPSPYPPFLS